MEKNPFVFNLSEKLEYTKDGDFTETATFELRAPGMSEFDLASDMSQFVARASIDIKDSATPDDIKEAKGSDQEVDAEFVKMLLFASKSVAFKDVASLFRKLAVKVGTIDGTTPLLDDHFNKMSISDFTEMACGYIANFIFPSLFSGEGE